MSQASDSQSSPHFSHRSSRNSGEAPIVTNALTLLPYVSPVRSGDQSPKNILALGSQAPLPVSSSASGDHATSSRQVLEITPLSTRRARSADENHEHWNSVADSSIMTDKAVGRIFEQLGYPRDFRLHVVPPSMRPNFMPSPIMAFWPAQIDAGIRFPICPFLSQLCSYFTIPPNQIVPSSIRIALGFFILMTHYGGTPTPALFHACFDLKKMNQFFYFASRASGPVSFFGKPTSVDGKWHESYFAVTPLEGRWPCPSGPWRYATPLFSDRPAVSTISDENRAVINKLNLCVANRGSFRIVEMLRSPRILAHFGLYTPEERVEPLNDMDLDHFILVSDDENDPAVASTAQGSVTPTPLQVKIEGSAKSPAPPTSAASMSPQRASHGSDIAPKRAHSDDADRPSKRSKAAKEHPPSSSRKVTTRSDVLAHKKKESSSKAKSQVGRSTKDYFTISLPKSLMNSDLSDNHALITSLHTSDDNFEYSSKTLPQLVCLRDQKHSQLLAIESILSRKTIEASPENLQAALEAKEKQLNAKDLEVQKATNDHHLAQLEVIRLQSHLQEAHASLSKTAQDFARKTTALQEDLRKAQDRFNSSFDEGVSEGVKLCRERLLLTETGQIFLDELRKNLIDNYKLSTAYVAEMGPHLGHFINHGFKAAAAQAKELGFTGTLNAKKAAKGVQPSPAFRGDVTQPVDFTWWKPVIEETVSQLLLKPEIPADLPIATNPFFEFSPIPAKAITGEASPPPTLPGIAETSTPELIEEETTNPTLGREAEIAGPSPSPKEKAPKSPAADLTEEIL